MEVAIPLRCSDRKPPLEGTGRASCFGESKMSAVKLALDRYHMLAGDPRSRSVDETTEAFDRWLRGDVCDVVSQLCGNAAFQHAASWSERNLVQGAGTPSRAALELVDESFVEVATALVHCETRTPRQRSEVPVLGSAQLIAKTGKPYLAPSRLLSFPLGPSIKGRCAHSGISCKPNRYFHNKT